MRQVLSNAVWWTCIRPEDQDVFWQVGAVPRACKRARLPCDTGIWQGSPAYSVNCWDNEACYNQNMVGAVIDLIGRPPKEFCATKVPKGEEFSKPPSQTCGQPVYPMFYQRSAMLEYVWFSNGLAVPALLYDNTVGRLDFLTFTSHKDTSAIHVRQAGKVVGLIWPSVSPTPEAADSACRQLRMVLDKRVARRNHFPHRVNRQHEQDFKRRGRG